MKDPALVSACFMEDTKMKSNTTKHHDDNKDDHTATPQTDDFHGEAQNRTLQKIPFSQYSFSAHTELNTGGMKQTQHKKNQHHGRLTRHLKLTGSFQDSVKRYLNFTL